MTTLEACVRGCTEFIIIAFIAEISGIIIAAAEGIGRMIDKQDLGAGEMVFEEETVKFGITFFRLEVIETVIP